METQPGPASEVIRKLLTYGDLSFRDFIEVALYHPEVGYYTRPVSPVGKEGDYVTAPLLSPVFSYALGRLAHEFLERVGDGVFTIVDIGCGDGSLLSQLREQTSEEVRSRARFLGIDRSLSRVPQEAVRDDRPEPGELAFTTRLEAIAGDEPVLLLSNELYDAFPFARLVRRGEHLHELWVRDVGGGELEWSEHEAAPVWEDYFAANGVELTDGQFADVSLDWGPFYRDAARLVRQGLVVTFDYGYRAAQLFSGRARRFGTAAVYRGQRVGRDLLSYPGAQDLTAHVNFSDLERAGESEGFSTLFFDRQAKFLLTIGILGHELLRPAQEVETTGLADAVEKVAEREEARRLVLPDGIGADIRVLVQGKGVPAEGWSFQEDPFRRG